MDSLVKTLMTRDGITQEEAERQVSEAQDDLFDRLGEGEMPFDICEEHFGLGPDYLMDLI